MNRRILIATVAALSIGGITAASAEYDSSGAGTINPERFGYQSGNPTQKYGTQGYASDGYMGSGAYAYEGAAAYGSANTRVRVRDGYAGPRMSDEYSTPRGRGW